VKDDLSKHVRILAGVLSVSIDLPIYLTAERQNQTHHATQSLRKCSKLTNFAPLEVNLDISAANKSDKADDRTAIIAKIAGFTANTLMEHQKTVRKSGKPFE
jgi:hypothetical protein